MEVHSVQDRGCDLPRLPAASLQAVPVRIGLDGGNRLDTWSVAKADGREQYGCIGKTLETGGPMKAAIREAIKMLRWYLKAVREPLTEEEEAYRQTFSF